MQNLYRRAYCYFYWCFPSFIEQFITVLNYVFVLKAIYVARHLARPENSENF